MKQNGRRRGRLRFKGAQWFKTFTYNQSGFSILPQETRYDRLHLAKIGDIPMIMHREVKGKTRQITIKHAASGKWYAHVVADAPLPPPPLIKPEKKVGIDLGIMHFVADSDGKIVENPKHLSKSLEKLAVHQKRLSRKQKGSKNRKKAKIKVARIHEKVVNQRNDFLHKLSRHYVDEYTHIAVEDLNVAGMARHPHLSRSIHDASWSRFLQMLCTKAGSAGCRVMTVKPYSTSQRCSGCGTNVPKTLAQRVHTCNCGLVIDRDVNAARNILQKSLGQELSEVTPVEIGSLLPHASHVGASPVVEAGRSAF